MQQSVQQRLVPPPKPPPPNFGASPRPGPTVAIPVSPAVPESPASPVGSAYSPTDTPTKRITPSPYSPNRLACDRSYYVARQDHQFALPADCPDNRPARPPMPFSAANPPLQPAPEAHRERVRRRAPSPPRPVDEDEEVLIWPPFMAFRTCPELFCGFCTKHSKSALSSAHGPNLSRATSSSQDPVTAAC